MNKPLKSQWDFGELFPAEATRRVLTVSELTASVKRLLEREVGQVWVTGEITNLRLQSSGHAYFSLKDSGAQLNCVLFRGEAAGFSRDLLSDGQKVVLFGDLTVYETRGQYQLRVTKLELQGVGALQIAFEKLKQKLNAEGLFAPERKRALPRYPRRIGIVTSPTGAALRDVIHVIERRNPALELVLAPCRVQGRGAAEEVAAAIRLLNEWAFHEPIPLIPSFSPIGREGARRAVERDSGPPSVGAPGLESTEPLHEPTPALLPGGELLLRAPNKTPLPGGAGGGRLDLILVTRGGGSLEDLWAFNEEIVARAIYESAVPVVSAVGHEIDFTISDFVADVRAATPSVAAELITEGVFASREFIAHAPAQLGHLVRERIEVATEALDDLLARFGRTHPRRRIQEQAQRLDDLQSTLLRCVHFGFREQFARGQTVGQRLLRLRPSLIVQRRRELLIQLQAQLQDQTRNRLKSFQSRFQTAEARLRLLSPNSVLERGYSITLDAGSGKIIRAAQEVRAGQRLRTRLKAGEIGSVVAGERHPALEIKT
ncbi:MAG: exodeoxyribonuclease VII large subunit [Verrucomicrobia bacterium]|nr:exodeoxyribonuclease VII large subunit [Verrucomicrobiota bacterium]